MIGFPGLMATPLKWFDKLKFLIILGTKSNAWALFRSGKSAFKKGELIECFNPLGS